MSQNTLLALSRTLTQVGAQLGAQFSARGLLVAGAVALALASPRASHAQGVFDNEQGSLGVAQRQADHAADPGAETGGMSGQTARHIGRVVGGIAGASIGTRPATKAVGAVAGVLIGGPVADAIHQAAGGVEHPQGATAADRALAMREPPAPTRSATRVLQPDITQRMNGLVVQAAAARLVAQRRYEHFNRAEIDVATLPGNTAAATRLGATRQDFSVAMQNYRNALSNLHAATTTLTNSGYSAGQYVDVSRELTRKVDQNGLLPFRNPAIVQMADQLDRELPSVSFVAIPQQAGAAESAQARRQAMAEGYRQR